MTRWLSTTSYYGFLPDGELWATEDLFRPALRARLRSLQPEVQAALAQQDYAKALGLAYRTLEALAHELRPVWANTLSPDQALIQALLVEVERCPLVALEDMTLQELQGTAVWVSHRAWATTREEALAIARRLTTSLRDLTGFGKPVRSRPWQVVTWSDGRVVGSSCGRMVAWSGGDQGWS